MIAEWIKVVLGEYLVKSLESCNELVGILKNSGWTRLELELQNRMGHSLYQDVLKK